MKTIGYIHTLDGCPARYSKEQGQTCFCSRSFPTRMVPTLKKLRDEQAKSNAWREREGLCEQFVLGYVRVEG